MHSSPTETACLRVETLDGCDFVESANTREKNEMSNTWNAIVNSGDYGESVYPLTRFPKKRERIIQEIEKLIGSNRDEIRILIMGCGSDTHLQKHLLEEFPNAKIVASDFSKEMIRKSKADFSHSNLHHVLGDNTKLPFKEGSFDVILKTNVMYPTRKDVGEAYSSSFRVSRLGGRLIAYLPSFDYAENQFLKEAKRVQPNFELPIDPKEEIVMDTSMQQCFHRKTTIQKELVEAGFRDIEVGKAGVEDDREAETLNKHIPIVGVEAIEKDWYEYLVSAKKPETRIEDKGDYILETIPSVELDEETINEIADIYAYVFNTAGHYLYFPKADEFLSISETPKECFDDSQDFIDSRYPEIERMYALKKFPKHPKTGEEAIFWHNREVTRKVILEKLKQDAIATIARNNEGKIVGFIFANKTSLREEFYWEGWEETGLYAGIELKQRDHEFFKQRVNETLLDFPEFGEAQLDDNSEVFAWNAVATLPEFRGRSVMMHSFFTHLPQQWKENLIIIGESRYQSFAHFMFKAIGAKDVDGVLCDACEGEKDSILLIAKLDEASRIYTNPKEFRKNFSKARKVSKN